MEYLKHWKTIQHNVYFFEVNAKPVGILEVVNTNFDKKVIFKLQMKMISLF